MSSLEPQRSEGEMNTPNNDSLDAEVVWRLIEGILNELDDDDFSRRVAKTWFGG